MAQQPIRNNSLQQKDLIEKSAGSSNSSKHLSYNPTLAAIRNDIFKGDLSQKVQHMKSLQQGPFRIRSNSDELVHGG
jgi:hypothetical protein